MSGVLESSHGRSVPSTGRAFRICRILAYVFAVVGLFASTFALVSIVLAIVAGVKGERRAWAAIPLALALAVFGLVARVPVG